MEQIDKRCGNACTTTTKAIEGKKRRSVRYIQHSITTQTSRATTGKKRRYGGNRNKAVPILRRPGTIAADE